MEKNRVDEHTLAEAVRRACIRAAQDGYEQARFDGLCHEGAWENAIGAMQKLDLNAILRDAAKARPST